QGTLDEEATRRAQETIERSARCQAQIIDDLLEVSRIIAGKMRIEVSPVHLARVIEAAVEVVRPAAEAKAIQLQAVLDTEGGTVHAESPGPGHGAVFTVKLPLMRARTASEVERRHPTAGVAVNDLRLDGVRVLLVDDEPDSNEAVGNLLASCGADVRAAGSAAQARDILAGWKADVLVSDIGMPDEDGYALIASLRATEAQIP